MIKLQITPSNLIWLVFKSIVYLFFTIFILSINFHLFSTVLMSIFV